MSWLNNVPLASVSYIDREQSTADLQLYFPLGTDVDVLLAWLRDEMAFRNVSDCIVYEVSVSLGCRPDTTQALDGSSLSMSALLFTTANNQYGTMAIPSITPDVLVQSGCFSNLAIDITNPMIVALSEAIIDAHCCTPDMQQFTTLVSGTSRYQWFPIPRRSG